MIGTPRQGRAELLDEDLSSLGDLRLNEADYSRELSDAGAWSLSVPNAGTPNATAAEPGRFVRFRYIDDDHPEGEIDFTGLIERREVVPTAARPDRRIRVVRGRDWLCLLADAPVIPKMGLAHLPAPSLIRFDWTHPDYVFPNVRPTYLGPLFTGNVDPSGNPMDPNVPGKFGHSPTAWPDVFTGWIWSAAQTHGTNSRPQETSYFDLPITLTTGGFLPIFTGDDYAELAFDGTILDRGVEYPTQQWTKCAGAGIPEVTAGAHRIRIKATNDSRFGTVNNIAAIAFVGYQPSGADTWLKYTNVKARTGSGVNSGDPLLGGNWSVLHAPANPPRFTAGHAAILLLVAAGLGPTGHLPGLTYSFSATHDSNGNPWPLTDELTARIHDDSVLDTFIAWHEAAHWEFAMDPASMVLHAWRYGQRGDNWTNPGSPLTWDGRHAALARSEGKR